MKKAFDAAVEIISVQARSFWVDRDVRRRAQWEACRLMAELGQAVEEVRPEVTQLASKGDSDAARWVEGYARSGGWYRVDLLQRNLEAWIARMDDEPEADQALGVVRRHHEDLLKKMATSFSRAFVHAGWTVSGALNQTRIYPEVVERMGGRVAYFFVDAMRYEMGVELTQLLQQSEDVTVRSAIAVLPSIHAPWNGGAASRGVIELLCRRAQVSPRRPHRRHSDAIARRAHETPASRAAGSQGSRRWRSAPAQHQVAEAYA